MLDGRREALTFNNWHKYVAGYNGINVSTLIPLPQVGVAVHNYLLICSGAREGSVSRDSGWVHIKHVANPPGDSSCCSTPEGDVTSPTHIRGSWVGLSEDHRTYKISI